MLNLYPNIDNMFKYIIRKYKRYMLLKELNKTPDLKDHHHFWYKLLIYTNNNG